MKLSHRSTARGVLVIAALALASGCAAGRPPAATPQPAPEPDEIDEAPPMVEEPIREPRRDILGPAVYDLPVEANSWVESELDFLVGQRSEVIARWLERGDFYEPYIRDVLREHGIPTDLYHLAMIESGFVATARSHAGAVGMWQFMPATGRAMGLRVDPAIDERMDPVRSTRAAARHLRSLHRALGDWALAAAAYNAGSGRITRGLRGFGVTNFWDLAQQGDLAEETRRYVPRLYAVTVIGRNRARYGFPPADPAEQFAYDSLQVEFQTPLSELARISEVEESTLRRLNPHLLQGVTPAGGYWVWVPSGRGADAQRAWLASDFRRDRGLGTYRVRAGDNLSMLAQRSGVRSARIRELNPSVSFDPLGIGVELRLPYLGAQALNDRPAPDARPVVVAAERTAPSSTTPERTAQVGTAPAAREAAPAGSDAAARVRSTGSDAAPRAASSSVETAPAPAPPAAPAVANGSGAAAERSHRVAAGETLWSISRAYGVTVGELEGANGLAGSTIRVGQTLRIPAGATPAAPAARVAASSAVEPTEHVVSAGESLWGIARQHGSTVEAIRAANDLGDRPIQPGQRLRVPRVDAGTSGGSGGSR